MFAIPPPPRYPTASGMPPTVIETQNVLTHPEGSEFKFQVGEGTYILRDNLQLATPPPHPSEAPVSNPNPLATTTQPPTSGVKLSLLTLNPQRVRPQLYKLNTTSSLLRWRTLGKQDGKGKDARETEKDLQPSTDTSSERSVVPASNASTSNKSNTLPIFGESNLALTPVTSRDALKRRKPKNNIVKSNSSFVSRVIPHDHLVKKLADRDPGGTFVFLNINRAFQWLDVSPGTKYEQFTKILFTKAHILCHDINRLTKDAAHIDLIMGSSASDIIWYEPMSQKYARINKNGMINNSPVSHIKWIPGSENLFLAAHTDGQLIVYDKEKEDAPFVSEDVADLTKIVGMQDDQMLSITKSVNSANQKANPVASWKLSAQPISEFAFSPDGRHLAVVGEDGYLRIVNYLQEKLIDLYPSYYGGFTCVCWSPDGKYILTGGQDDLVSIWSLSERQIIARCPGHDSWVTAVAFDPWRCDDKTYRFGSVGEDCKLLLWDFNVGMLHRPKGTIARARGSVSAQSISLSRHRTESASMINRMRSDPSRSTNSHPADLDEDAEFINHTVEARSRTAQLPPVMSKQIDSHPLSSIAFEQDYIMTACVEGHVRTWDRPKEGINSSEIDLSSSENAN